MVVNKHTLGALKEHLIILIERETIRKPLTWNLENFPLSIEVLYSVAELLLTQALDIIIKKDK